MALQSASNPITTIPAGSSATSVVPVVLDNGISKAAHTMVVVVSAGFASGVVTLELSHDNVNWFTSGSPPTLAASTVFSQTIQAVAQFARARISTVIAGGTVLATVASAQS